ncbi:MAG: hypothetical protein WCI27_05945 [Candidatus Omnitrophota bacterium]
MIRVDLAVAVAFCLSAGAVFVWFMWRRGVVENIGNHDCDSVEYVLQCPYCSHIILDDGKMKIVRCPLCRSYLEEALHAPKK